MRCSRKCAKLHVEKVDTKVIWLKFYIYRKFHIKAINCTVAKEESKNRWWLSATDQVCWCADMIWYHFFWEKFYCLPDNNRDLLLIVTVTPFSAYGWMDGFIGHLNKTPIWAVTLFKDLFLYFLCLTSVFMIFYWFVFWCDCGASYQEIYFRVLLWFYVLFGFILKYTL